MLIVKGLFALALVAGIAACAHAPGPVAYPYSDSSRVQLLGQLLPADVILLGEQHDAQDHQRVHRLVVQTLASQDALAALALEMASQGRSTAHLTPDASEEAVRSALQWSDDGWPWAAYGPAVMASVRAGVPVLGANLPRAGLRDAMANTGLDRLLSGPALKAQQQSIRSGHCDMLPESQIAPMARIQIARDLAMAQTVSKAVQTGKTVVLLAGGAHVDRELGVPLHLAPAVRAKAVLMQAEPLPEDLMAGSSFDAIWPAQAAVAVDYCSKFGATRRAPA
ncbi:MAG: ChaN family lipoprotein [Rhodoferax sp.]